MYKNLGQVLSFRLVRNLLVNNPCNTSLKKDSGQAGMTIKGLSNMLIFMYESSDLVYN